MNLTLVTGNAGKVEQLELLLGHSVEHQALDIPEIQSLDLAEIATAKAQAAYSIIGSPVLVEDVSLTFHALGALPGPLIKWFRESLGNDGLTKILDGYTDRSCTAQVCYAFCDESGVHLFYGSVSGHIAETPRGENGFGWGPIFIPTGYNNTWGEMEKKERADTSMRKEALLKLKQFLEESN